MRHVDAGSDGTEEWEILALINPVYDMHRLGIFFTASPRHADILLVTGAGARGMAEPLRRTYEAMPDPKVVIAVGTDAISGGLVGPVLRDDRRDRRQVPVDVWVPGSPPSPFSILHALLLASAGCPQAGSRERAVTAFSGVLARRAGAAGRGGRGLTWCSRARPGWPGAVPARRGRVGLPGRGRRGRAGRADGPARGRLAGSGPAPPASPPTGCPGCSW